MFWREAGARDLGGTRRWRNLAGKPCSARMLRLGRATPSESRAAIVVGARNSTRDFGRGLREDRWPGEGPLGGIITALLATAETDERRRVESDCELRHAVSDAGVADVFWSDARAKSAAQVVRAKVGAWTGAAVRMLANGCGRRSCERRSSAASAK